MRPIAIPQRAFDEIEIADHLQRQLRMAVRRALRRLRLARLIELAARVRPASRMREIECVGYVRLGLVAVVGSFQSRLQADYPARLRRRTTFTRKNGTTTTMPSTAATIEIPPNAKAPRPSVAASL